MEIDITETGDTARISIAGDVDESGAGVLKARFNERNLGQKKEVVLDFHEVRHIGSAGIGKLLLFYKDLAVHEGKLRIIGASKPIFDLFREMKLDTIFILSGRQS